MCKKILVAYDGTREGQRGLLEFAKTPPQPDLDIHLLAVIRLSAQDIMAETYLPNSIDDETQQYQKIIQEGRGSCRSAATGHDSCRVRRAHRADCAPR